MIIRCMDARAFGPRLGGSLRSLGGLASLAWGARFARPGCPRYHHISHITYHILYNITYITYHIYCIISNILYNIKYHISHIIYHILHVSWITVARPPSECLRHERTSVHYRELGILGSQKQS